MIHKYENRNKSTSTLHTICVALGMIVITFPIIFIFGFSVRDVLGHPLGNNICYPASDYTVPQYIVGYGSLMNKDSKLRTDPTAGPSFPIRISGYRRKWDAQGDSSHKYSVTFLGTQPDASSTFNAVAFQVYPTTTQADPVGAYDFREDWYCRQKVNVDSIQFLTESNSQDNELIPEQGIESPKQKYENAEFWIYVTRPTHTALPDETHPIRLSYVDTFLSGCLEIQDTFKIDGFASECVNSTSDWGTHWLKNRDSSANSPSEQDRIDSLLFNIFYDYGQIKLTFSAGSRNQVNLEVLWHLGLFQLVAVCLWSIC